MNLRKSTEIQSFTVFVLGVEDSGYIQLAVQEAAKRGETLVITAVAPDILTGVSPIDGEPMPEVTVVEINSADDLGAVVTELNKMRAEDKYFDAIVFVGVGHYAAFVAADITKGGQPTQQEFGQIARIVNFDMRLLRGYARKFYAVTCDIRDDEESGGKRFNVQPAISNTLAGELANAWYVAGKADGTRLIQRDGMLALNFIAGRDRKEENDTEEKAESRPRMRSRA